MVDGFSILIYFDENGQFWNKEILNLVVELEGLLLRFCARCEVLCGPIIREIISIKHRRKKTGTKKESTG